MHFPISCLILHNLLQDSLAEWSKALALGASPKGRGFEPHFCQFLPKPCSWKILDPLGFEPRAFCMRSRRDTTTPRARATFPLANFAGMSREGSATSLKSLTRERAIPMAVPV